ncbi:MAG TPA: hypothetical protein PK131_01795 [Candidatus Woesebacteria bacterium]|nr:hypothetical protein [Candidatus Woesebacteria bacterium]
MTEKELKEKVAVTIEVTKIDYLILQELAKEQGKAVEIYISDELAGAVREWANNYLEQLVSEAEIKAGLKKVN